MHCGIHDSAYVRMYYYPQPPPARAPRAAPHGPRKDAWTRRLVQRDILLYPDNIQPSPGPGLMCKLMCVCVWCPARMSGNGGMHYSDRTHISHEILAVFSFLVCHVMKDPNLLKGEVRSVDSHHALTPSRTFLSFPSFDSGIPQGEESVGVLLPERARPLLRGERVTRHAARLRRGPFLRPVCMVKSARFPRRWTTWPSGCKPSGW